MGRLKPSALQLELPALEPRPRKADELVLAALPELKEEEPKLGVFLGPVRPEGPGAGSLEYWEDRLRELDTSPTYLNGVPVKRHPCAPLRFRVTRFNITANIGMGCGAWEPVTWEMATLREAAVLVKAGRCPHFKLIKGTLNYVEQDFHGP